MLCSHHVFVWDTNMDKPLQMFMAILIGYVTMNRNFLKNMANAQLLCISIRASALAEHTLLHLKMRKRICLHKRKRLLQYINGTLSSPVFKDSSQTNDGCE